MQKLTWLGTVLVLMMMLSTVSVHAAVWKSSDPWGTWNNGGYTIENDVWGTKAPNQTIWANSYNVWGVLANYTGGGIKCYANVDKSIGVPLLSLHTLTSSFSATMPNDGAYDLAYDIWCKDASGTSYETMIWMKWNNTKPIAQNYNAQGTAMPLLTNQHIGGQTFDVYRRGTVVSFLRTNQEAAGTVNIKAVLDYINNHGWFSNPVLSKVQFGWEITSTIGWQRFNMNHYSVTHS